MSNNSVLRPALRILFFYFLEVTFAERLGAFAPPLVLAAVIGISLERGAGAGLAAGFAAGLLFEPFASGPFGVLPFAYALVGAGTGMLASKIFGESVLLRAIWPCLAMAAAGAVEALWGRPSGASASFWEAWGPMVSPARLLTMALVAPLVTAAMKSSEPRAAKRTVYR